MNEGACGRRITNGFLLTAVFVLGGFAALAVSTDALGATLAFDPPSGVIVCDETLTVDVTIDASVTDLRGFTLVFEFDPAIVAPVSATAGALVTGAGCPNFFTWLNAAAIGDSIAIDGATLGCSVAGAGSIAQLRFVGTGIGTSALDCRSGSMRDSQNAEIPFTCVPGTIEYSCQTPVESETWGRVKALYR
ncbi:MAG: cohesin domain-containing protein [bacterium]